jgi:hypothetical protein
VVASLSAILCGLVRNRIAFAIGVVLAAAACSEPPAKAEPSATASTAPEVASSAPATVDRSPLTLDLVSDRLPLTAAKLDTRRLDPRYTDGLTDDRALNVHALRGAMFVSYAGVIAELRDQELAIDYASGAVATYTVLSMGGSWPDRITARVFYDSWRSTAFQRSPPVAETKIYGYAKGELTSSGTDDVPLKVAGWKNGTNLSLVAGELKVEGPGDPPKQQPPRDGAGCKTRQIAAEELDALPSGEAFLLGRHCGAGAYALEVFDAVGQSRIEDLPDAPANVKRGFITAGSPKSVFAMLSTGERVYLARWDGAAARKLELDASGDVSSVWATADGALFFILKQKFKAELWRVLPSGQVRKSDVFAPSPGAQVWAADADTAYVPSFSSILSTKPGLEFTGYATKEGEPGGPNEALSPPRSGLPAHHEDCKTPFVWLFDVVESSAEDFTFPNTRAALSSFPKRADIKLVELWLGSMSNRKLGAVVPMKSVGEELIAHVRKTMKNENPKLVCYAAPADARAILIE